MVENHSTDVHIEILQPGDQARLEEFVRPHLHSSLFLVSNSRKAGFADHGRRLEGTYYAAMIGDQIVGVAAHYWQGNLILQAPQGIQVLIETVRGAGGRSICGLFGPAGQVGRAREHLGWGDSRLESIEGLYALPLADLKVPEALLSGRLRGRRLAPGDLDLVSAWRRDYQLELLGAEDNPELLERCRSEMQSSQQRGDTWVLEDEGELVASTSFNATIDEAVQVGGVWTPRDLRGRGYGTAVVAVSLLDARAEGVPQAILFTGDDNIGAQRAYAKLGFERIGDYRIILQGG